MAVNVQTASSSKQCDLCGKSSKYCCPKCSVRTCSLSCVQSHKKLFNCDGERDKSAYKSVKQFTDIDLLNDYRLLEETGRLLDNVCRTKREKHAYYQPYLPHWLHRLKVECRLRGINLQLLPSTFSKRTENTTRYIFGDRKIVWKIKWKFPQCNTTRIDQKVPETIPLGTVLEDHFKENETSQANTCLAYYKAAGLGGIKILLQSNFPETHPKFGFYELDASESLKVSLKGRTILEFPTLLVVLKDHIYSYPLLDPEVNEYDSLNNKDSVKDLKPILIDRRDINEETCVKEEKTSKYFDF